MNVEDSPMEKCFMDYQCWTDRLSMFYYLSDIENSVSFERTVFLDDKQM